METRLPQPPPSPPGAEVLRPTRGARRARHFGPLSRRRRGLGGSGGILLPVLLATLAGTVPAHAGDPSLRWRTLKTEHFEINFARRHRAAAERVAVVCEAAHRLLSPFLKHQPSGRVRVLLTDYTDGANGSASVIPRNVMRLFLSSPDSVSTLNDYDDWMVGLIFHEYTHILHLDTIGGIAKLINWIFGKTASPNHLQPSWWIEGIAILSESRFTAGGRNKNSLYDMYLRAAVLEEKTQDLGEISSAPVRFPHGSTPYLYGSRFLKYLASRYGRERLVRISHDYGDEWIPYGFNKVARRHLQNKGYVQLYREWIRDLRRRYRLQARAVRRRGLRAGARLSHSGEYTYWPRFHPSGRWLAFSDDDGKSDHALKRLAVGGGAARKLIRLEGGGASSFDPDGDHLVYHQWETHRAVYDYQDLFELDLRTGRRRRLTHAQRMREPDVSPDGRRIAAVLNRRGTTHLVTLPRRGLREGQRPRVLVRSRRYEQVATPRWSPDGKTLAYSAWRQGGKRDVVLVDVATGKQRRLTDDRAQDITPAWSPDGRTLYFASDRTGIYNIYAADVKSGALRQVTNVVNGALMPAVSPDGETLAYVGFTARGYDLFRMPLRPGRFLPALPYLNDRREPRIVGGETPPFTVQDYNPLLSLYPESWWLQAGFTPGDEFLTVLLQGNDMAELHWWNLSASYNFGRRAVAVNGSYSYLRLWPSLSLSLSYARGPRGGLTLDQTGYVFTEQNLLLAASMGLPILRSRRFGSATLRFTYRYQRFDPVDEPDLPLDPSLPQVSRPERGQLSGVSLGFSYGRLYGYRYSVSAEKGRSLGLYLSLYTPVLGSDFQLLTVTWSWIEYLPMPWLEHHVLALRLAGGITRGDLGRRGFYTVGGLPNQELLQALIDVAPVGGAYLRGYPAAALWGDQYHLFNAEYRLPITWINWAPWTLPIYFRRLYAAAYCDVGAAFFGPLEREDVKVGVGAELLLDLVIGYYQPLTFRVGYAYGIMEPGGHSTYFLFGVPFN